MNVQGKYPARTGSMPTCRVSSIGDRTGLIAPPGIRHRHRDDMSEFASCDFVEMICTVRVRDGEFLVGSLGIMTS